VSYRTNVDYTCAINICTLNLMGPLIVCTGRRKKKKRSKNNRGVAETMAASNL
jgi:hypothetical protein